MILLFIKTSLYLKQEQQGCGSVARTCLACSSPVHHNHRMVSTQPSVKRLGPGREGWLSSRSASLPPSQRTQVWSSQVIDLGPPTSPAYWARRGRGAYNASDLCDEQTGTTKGKTASSKPKKKMSYGLVQWILPVTSALKEAEAEFPQMLRLPWAPQLRACLLCI